MSITVHTSTTTENLVGKSHWWGAPDLPVDMPYPYVVENAGTDDEYADPLTFICQIRLADIAPFDMQRLLPQTGMLYFFATIDYFLGDFDAPMGDIAHNCGFTSHTYFTRVFREFFHQTPQEFRNNGA